MSPRALYRSLCLSLTPRTNADPEVDLYEMRWADLSRFPNRLIAALIGIYALILQLPTLALEAIKPIWSGSEHRLAREDRTESQDHTGLGRTLRFLLEALGWWLAVPVLSAALMTIAILAGAAAVIGVDRWLSGSTMGYVVALGLVAIATGVLAGRVANLIRDQGYGLIGGPVVRRILSPHVFAVVWVVATVALVCTRLILDPTPPVALANALTLAVVHPFRWAWLGVVIIVALCLVCTALVLAATRTRWWKALYTTVLVLMLAPTAMAAANTFTVGIAGAAVRTVAAGYELESSDDLLCLEDSDSWGTGCAPESPVSVVGWGEQLFGHPLLALGQLLAVWLLMLIAIVAVTTLVWLRGNFRIEGAGLSELLRTLGSPAAAIAAGLLVALQVVTSLVWVISPDGVAHGLFGVDADRMAEFLLTATLLVIAVFGLNGVTPFKIPGVDAVRRGLVTMLDLAYDVAVWRRAPHPELVVPRERMIGRFHGLLRLVADGGPSRTAYDHVIIVPHSQGNVITAGALFGDPYGPPDETQPDLPRLSVLGCANPLAQSYEPRLPGRYDWLGDPDKRQRLSNDDFTPITEGWVNLYRPRDYIGRAIWTPDALQSVEASQPDYRYVAPVSTGIHREDECIREFRRLPDGSLEARRPSGWHTGYWSEPRVIERLDELLLN